MFLRSRLHTLLSAIIFLSLFLIPIVWSREVNANYYTTKTTLLYLTGGLCFLYLALTSKDFKWPQTTHWLGVIGVFFIGLQVLYSLIFNYPLSLFFLPKLFAFLGVFVFLVAIDFDLQKFFKKFEWIVLLFFCILLALTIHNAIELFLDNDIFPTGRFMVPFGNVNMMSEFYVLSLPFAYYWVSQKIKISAWVKWPLFILVNLVLLQAKSRSAYIGQCLWWMVYFYEFSKGWRRILYMALVPVFFYGVTRFNAYVSEGKEEFKASSSAERMNFYYATRDLIEDSPFGIGLQYANKIVPYRMDYPAGPNEFEYPDQPHSEILKWGVELGWIPLLIVIITGVWITIIVFSRGPFILKGALMVSGPQIVFQFPFENPASLLWMAFFIYLFYQLLPARRVLLVSPLRVLSFVLTAFLVWQSYVFWKSILYTSQFPNDLELTRKACQMNPTYLPGCIMKNYNLLFAKKFDELKVNLKKDMAVNYYNVDFLKITAAMLFETAKLKPPAQQNEILRNTCEVMHVYGTIFKEQKHFAPSDMNSCQVVPKPFGFHRPQQFQEDYEKWLEKIFRD